jgi:FkbM family methyltransferase
MRIKNRAKNIYRLIPFKRSLFSVCRDLLHPGERIYKHLHFEGEFSVSVDSGHRFQIHHFGFEVENSLFWAGLEGGWERTSIGLWKRLVSNSQVVFDVGANTGVYSLIAKCLNPDAKVIALEPISRVFSRLEGNVQLNGYDIECLELAASNFDGSATVYDTPTEHVYSVTVNKNLNAPETPVIPTEIRTARLDAIIADRGVKQLDLIKIDVETHEPEVLEGLGDHLVRFRPSMLIEVLNDEIGRRIEEIIKGIGYLYFNIDERNNKVTRMKSITKSDYYNYLLCSEDVARELGIL